MAPLSRRTVNTGHHKKTKTRKRSRHLRGGSKTPSFLTPDPITATPLKYGATNPSEEAFLENQMIAENQQRMNDGLPPVAEQSGGAVVIPQSDGPLANEPGGTNETNTQLNEIIMQQQADSVMDGCVGQGAGCTSSNYWDGTGGRRNIRQSKKHKKHTKSRRIRKTKSKKHKKHTKSRRTRKQKKHTKSRKSRK